MSKINISLNGSTFELDESVLASASTDIKSHLSSVMNGEGAVIKFDGVDYNVDSTKLSAATNDFVAHLGTIAGEGAKIRIGDIEYSVDSSKISGALSNLESAFDALGTPEVVYSEGFDFTSNGDGTCIVFSLGSCTDNDLVIPPVSPKGDKVVEIGEGSFYNCDSLTSVVIPDSVTTIRDAAFYDCVNLVSIVFDGSTSQWNAISKISQWNYNTPATHVQCSDGQVAL